MKKLRLIILIGIVLNLIEFILLYFELVIEGLVLYSVPRAIILESVKEAAELSLTRLFFYFIFWIITIFFFYDKVKIKNIYWKFAIINSTIYIFISAVMTLLFPFAIDFFFRSFFYYITLSTFISPFLLLQFSYFKKNINSLSINT